MSQNLIGVIKKYKNKWYVFPEPAEAVLSDTITNPEILNKKEFTWDEVKEKPESEWERILEITNPSTLGPYDSLEECMNKAETDFDPMFGFEYGLSTATMIDGVKLILTYKNEPVEDEIYDDEETLNHIDWETEKII